MALARLDHVIYAVPDIVAAHEALSNRFPEAWPVGRFWPFGRTSGIALGGINLELLQPDEGAPGHPHGYSLAFQPTSLEAAIAAFTREGLGDRVDTKTESDPALLRLRGFDEEASKTSQLICRNLLPANPEPQPFGFFVCDYSPFLRNWLSPKNPRLSTEHRVVKLSFGTPEPLEATRLFNALGYEGDIAIEFVQNQARGIVSIETTAGSLGWP